LILALYPNLLNVSFVFKKIVNVFKKSVAFSKKNWYIKCVQMVCKYEPVPEVVGVPKRRKL